MFLNSHRQEQGFYGQQALTREQVQQNFKGKTGRTRVIELTATTSCSGKTQLLYLIAASSLLPTHPETDSVNNGGSEVIWLDADCRFSIFRLQQIILQCIGKSYERVSSLGNSELIQRLCNISLEHLHVFRPQSFDSLISTIISLPSYLFKSSLHQLASRPLRLVIISSLSAFLGSDNIKSDVELPTTPEQSRGNHFNRQYVDLTASLKGLLDIFDCTIIATNWSLSPLQEDIHGVSIRNHLPNIWNNLCMMKLLVKRDRVLKFEPKMSVEETANDGVVREEVLSQSKFSCHLNHWGSEEWSNGVSRELRVLENRGGFSFEINEDGVVVTV